jgi:copper chaperone CopZ
MGEQIKLSIPGMKCGGCVSAVEKALREEIGVIRSEVNLATKTALVESSVPSTVLSAAIKNAGFDAIVLNPNQGTEAV